MLPLKVFVATTRTQGHRDNDAAHVDGPELVVLAMSCDLNGGTPHDGGDGGCGGARAFTGLSSGKITTTAEIAERDLTLVQYRNVVHRSLVTAGFDDDPELRREAEQAANEMARIAAVWPVGTVVERRGAAIFVRAWPTSSATGGRTRATTPATRSDVAAIAAGSAHTRTVGAGLPLATRFHRLVLHAACPDVCRRSCHWSHQDSSGPVPRIAVETPRFGRVERWRQRSRAPGPTRCLSAPVRVGNAVPLRDSRPTQPNKEQQPCQISSAPRHTIL